MTDAEFKELVQEHAERTQDFLERLEEYLENRDIADVSSIEDDPDAPKLEYTPLADPPFHLGADVQKNWARYRTKIIGGKIDLVCETPEKAKMVRAAMEIQNLTESTGRFLDEQRQWRENKKKPAQSSPDRDNRELMGSALMDACNKHFDAGDYDECKKALEAWLQIWSRDSYMVPSDAAMNAFYDFKEKMRQIEAPWRGQTRRSGLREGN